MTSRFRLKLCASCDEVARHAPNCDVCVVCNPASIKITKRGKRPSSYAIAPNFTERFCDKITHEGDCYIWTGFYTRGSPMISAGGNNINVRKAAFEVQHGYHPKHHVRTSCGNAKCVRPSHQMPLDSKLAPNYDQVMLRSAMDNYGMAWCYHCKTFHNRSEFTTSKESWNGLTGQCRAAHSEQARNYRQNNPMARFKSNMRCLIANAYGRKGFKKDAKSLEIFQCDWPTVFKRLGPKTPDTEIDHVIPLAWAKTVDEVRELGQIWNLERVPVDENRAKSAKAPDPTRLHPNLTEAALAIYYREISK